MTASAAHSIRLPRLHKLKLRSFSLYTLRPEVEMDIGDGVFCLAGANGLGKSSFIAALNFVMTGGVAPKVPALKQLSTYRNDAARTSTAYFEGRIAETDRLDAEITIEFTIGGTWFRLVRGLFEARELRYLQVQAADGEVLYDHDAAADAAVRQERYERLIEEATGLSTFDQFVFLQHFVLSFDEWRHLLFWDSRATETVLYLALGLDPALAKRADELRKAANGAGSLARNAQFQVTSTRRDLQRLTAQLGTTASLDPTELERYRDNSKRMDELVTSKLERTRALGDARLDLAEATSRQLVLRERYERTFAERFSAGRGQRSLHPIVQQLLTDHLCRICGTQHEGEPLSLRAALDASCCPLCATDLEVRTHSVGRDELSALDEELRVATAAVAEVNKRLERVQREAEAIEAQIRDAREEIARFEVENESSLAVLKGNSAAELRNRAESLENAITAASVRKDEQLELRAAALKELAPIQNQLAAAWREAELEFVPRFRRLAEGFIGLPLQVELDQGAGMLEPAHLVLSVNSSHRRKSEQLSESQRFFLDIALRMSLAQHMSPAGEVCIYVDTPEGALDIAYEARAGDMFSDFVDGGGQIVMTANVNTSQLLRRMARRCGHGSMQMIRMTEWTTLSDVQMSEEALFSESYDLIEKALGEADQVES